MQGGKIILFSVIVVVIISIAFVLAINYYGKEKLTFGLLEDKSYGVNSYVGEPQLVERTSSSDKYDNGDGTYTLTLYSGIRNVYEDKTWKKVEDARSLKGSGIECVVNSDGEHQVECLDWNMTAVKLRTSIASASLSNTDVPIKVFKRNESGDLVKQKEITRSYSIGSNSKEDWIIADMGDEIHFGEESTEIILQDADTENLDDGMIMSESSFIGTEWGAADFINVLAGDEFEHIFIKFNISSLYDLSIDNIISSTCSIYSDGNNYDPGEELNLSTYHVFVSPEFNISNIEWTEGGGGLPGNACTGNELCWNTMPNLSSGQQYNSSTSGSIILDDSTTGWVNINCSSIISSAYDNSDDNVTILFNSTLEAGSPVWNDGDRIEFASKEDSTAGIRPYLNITLLLSDTTPPNITIQSPLNATTNVLPINFSITALDVTVVDSCWYSLTGGVFNYTMSNTTHNDIYNATNGSITDGAYRANFYCNDSLNNENNTEFRDFEVDTINPDILIEFPVNNTNFSINTIDINYTASDTNIQDCWFSNDSYSINYSLGDDCVNITNMTWIEGQHNVTVWVNDSAGNVNNTKITFTVDTIFPDILIEFPINLTNTTDTGLDVNYTTSDAGLGLDTCWWTNDLGATNTTLTDCTTNLTTETWLEGINNISVYVNDSVNNINVSHISFTLDTINPTVASLVEHPSDPTEYALNKFYQFNATITDTHLQTILFEFDGTNYTPTNEAGDVYNVSFTSLSAGVYNYKWYVNDTVGNINSSEDGDYTINQNSSLVLGISGTTPITYGTVTDVAGSDCPAELSCSLDKSNIVYGAGVETFNYSTVGNTNYTPSSITKAITINTATPTGSLTTSTAWIIEEGTGVTIGLSETNDGDVDVTYVVHRDDVDKGTGETWTPSLGTYDYILNTTGGNNYSASASMDAETLTVQDTTPPNINITFPINGTIITDINLDINYTRSDTNLQNCWYSNDSMSKNITLASCGNLTSIVWTIGQHNVTVWVNDTFGNENESSVTFTISSIGSFVSHIKLNENSGTTAYEILTGNNGTIRGGTYDNDVITLGLTENIDYIISNEIFTIINNNLSWDEINASYLFDSTSSSNTTTILRTTGIFIGLVFIVYLTIPLIKRFKDKII